jgi:hypothetical protein
MLEYTLKQELQQDTPPEFLEVARQDDDKAAETLDFVLDCYRKVTGVDQT